MSKVNDKIIATLAAEQHSLLAEVERLRAERNAALCVAWSFAQRRYGYDASAKVQEQVASRLRYFLSECFREDNAELSEGVLVAAGLRAPTPEDTDHDRD